MEVIVTSVQLSLFDYSQLEVVVRDEAQQQVAAIKDRMRNVANDFVAIGKAICDLRNLLTDDQFEELIKAEFNFTIKTAEKYIHLHKTFGDVDFTGYIPMRTMELLAHPETPAGARQEAINLLSNGLDVTHTDARNLIDRYKPSFSGMPPSSNELEQRRNSLHSRWKITKWERMTPCKTTGCNYPMAHRAHELRFTWNGESNQTRLLCPNCHHTLDILVDYYLGAGGLTSDYARHLEQALGGQPYFDELASLAEKLASLSKTLREMRIESAAHYDKYRNGANGNGTAVDTL